ncbi:hypothetical protein AST99_00770 [Formosa algae]|nr:hypothetical protein AST99_00770 [Formosa algae]
MVNQCGKPILNSHFNKQTTMQYHSKKLYVNAFLLSILVGGVVLTICDTKLESQYRETSLAAFSTTFTASMQEQVNSFSNANCKNAELVLKTQQSPERLIPLTLENLTQTALTTVVLNLESSAAFKGGCVLSNNKVRI